MRNVNFNTDVEYEKDEKKKFGITRGKLLLIGIIALIIIVAIIIIVVSIQNSKKSKYTEEDFLLLERRMEEEAQIYVEQKQVVLTEKEYRIPLADLLDEKGGTIDPSRVKAAAVCDGYVIAKKIDMITYDAYISCGDDYITNGYSTLSGDDEEEVKTTTIRDVEKPIIVLVGEKNITLKVGEEWKEPGYTATDNIDKDITARVEVKGTVDTKIPGEYIITYTIKDSAGNIGEEKRVVKVVGNTTTTTTRPATTTRVNTTTTPPTTTTTKAQTTQKTTQTTTTAPKIPPTITLYGSKIINLKVGDKYTDPGYSATDCLGKDITSSVDVSGSVNTKVATTYYITYSVVDRYGNKSTTSRTIIVKPKNISVQGITITPNSLNLKVGDSKKLTVYITPSDASDKTLIWSSSNNSVATINNRTVYAKAKGTATITARSINGKKYSVKVTVK